MTQPLHKQAGFSLLEVMVALTILAVGIIAVMQLFPASLDQQRSASERTTIAALARTELGMVRAGGVGNQLMNWAEQNALRELTAAQRAYALYEGWRSTVQRVGGEVDLFRVTFSVTTGSGQEETFVTYVTQQ